jgi:N-acetylmuramic acid 6-phosphate etherase
MSSRMETERASPRFTDIDLWDPADILDCMIEAQFAALAAVRAARPAIEGAARAMEERLARGGRLIYAGAGTSGRLAVQDGAELAPTFGWPEERLLLLIAGGYEALSRSIEGAEDDVTQVAQFMDARDVGSDDVVVVVAASGTTPFAVEALREGKRRGALTIGIANNRDTPVLTESDCPVWLDTGSEVIAGSTRLKAGTAQKVTLNALSSLLMIRLGKVHAGLMVDVRATNEKLLKRSERILNRLTGCNAGDAREALKLAEGNLKVAALVLKGYERGEAERLLTESGQNFRKAFSGLTLRRKS